jgi:hypothetical protein
MYRFKVHNEHSSNPHHLVDVAFCKVENTLETVGEMKENVEVKKAKLQYKNVIW